MNFEETQIGNDDFNRSRAPKAGGSGQPPFDRNSRTYPRDSVRVADRNPPDLTPRDDFSGNQQSDIDLQQGKLNNQANNFMEASNDMKMPPHGGPADSSSSTQHDLNRNPPNFNGQAEDSRSLPPNFRGPPQDFRGPPPNDFRGPPREDNRGSPPPGFKGPPPDDFRGPPPPGFRGSQPDFRGPPPDDFRGLPPPGFRGPPSDDFRGPPQDFRGPPPDDFRGPPQDFRGPPPDDFRGPPQDFRGPPPDDFRGPPQDFRGPPPDDFRGPPQDFRGPPPDFRGPPPDDFRGPPQDFRGPPPNDFRGPPPNDFRGPPPNDFRGHPPDDFRGPSQDFRGPPPDDFRGPSQDFRGPPPDDFRGPLPPGFRGPPTDFRGPPDDFRGPSPPSFRGPPPDFRGTPNDFRGPPPPCLRGPPQDFDRPPRDSENEPPHDFDQQKHGFMGPSDDFNGPPQEELDVRREEPPKAPTARNRSFDDSFFQEISGKDAPSSIDYTPLNIDCLPESTQRSSEAIENYVRAQRVRILGVGAPNPILNFSEAPLSDDVMKVFANNGWTVPTPIQSFAIPIVLKGIDIVGVAKTGSGKTAAYVVPAFIHVQQQKSQKGPFVLILGPTRELAQQIGAVVNQFAAASSSIRAAVVYGGENTKRDQSTQIRANPQVIVATPGRLLDFIRSGVIDISPVSFLVIDEADRMLDMGFESQLKAITRMIQPKRQTVMWSATWPKEVRDLANNYMSNAIKVVVGESEISVNPNITQNFIQVEDMQKFELLKQTIENIAMETPDAYKILIFARRKADVDQISDSLSQRHHYNAMGTHGDKMQQARNFALEKFRTSKKVILVGTDVLARGLDVVDVTHVINYDLPGTIEDYVHRIGRTARADRKGTSISFFSRADKRMSRKIAKILSKAGQNVPPWLQEIANNTDPDEYKNTRR